MGAIRPCQWAVRRDGVRFTRRRGRRGVAGIMRGLVVVVDPSTGSGRTDLGGARAVGSGGCDGGGDAPRGAPLDSCLRRNDARGGVRAGEGCWWRRALRQAQGERVTPRTAPPALDSCLRRNDAREGARERRWGSAVWRGLVVAGGGIPLLRERPSTGSGRTGARSVVAGGVWGASSRRSPGRMGRHATRPRRGPRRPGRWGDGRVPPFAAGPPWRPP